jgi:hypothetical protein
MGSMGGVISSWRLGVLAVHLLSPGNIGRHLRDARLDFAPAHKTLSLLRWRNRQATASAPLAIARNSFSKEIVMIHLFSPVLADYIWIGGGTLGTILLIVIIVMILRR